MKLSKPAIRLLSELQSTEEELLKTGTHPWRQRMEQMENSRSAGLLEIFEELEAEGLLVMSVEEREGKPSIPRRIILKE